MRFHLDLDPSGRDSRAMHPDAGTARPTFERGRAGLAGEGEASTARAVVPAAGLAPGAGAGAGAAAGVGVGVGVGVGGSAGATGEVGGTTIRATPGREPVRLPGASALRPSRAMPHAAAAMSGAAAAQGAAAAREGSRAPTGLPVLQAAVPAGAEAVPPHRVVACEPGWFSASLAREGTLVVPAGCRVVGDCRAAQVWVAGEVSGNVIATSGALVVSEGACVRGRVEGAGPVVVAGHVRAVPGQPAVVARGRLDIACTARITGSVQHDVIAIYEGARIDGDIVGHVPPRAGST